LSQWGDSRKPEKFSVVRTKKAVVIDDFLSHASRLAREKMNCVFFCLDYTVGNKNRINRLPTL